LSTTRAPAPFVIALQALCAVASLDHLEDIGFSRIFNDTASGPA
jgi:hypothetical protein